MPTPVDLSILLPAYNYPDGIARTLTRLHALRACRDIEVLVSDDSTDARSAAAIRALAQAFPRATYRHNSPPLGAPGNWNRLIAEARGRYLWLIHHDEWPGDDQLAGDLLHLLKGADAPEVVVLGCCATRDIQLPASLHFPMPWVRQIVERWPQYLLRRNIIGAPSMIVASRTHYDGFDPQLRWYVDVDLYYRIFRQRPKVRVLQARFVLSLIRPGSITGEMRPELAALRVSERAYLGLKLGASDPAAWIVGTGTAARLTRAVEPCAWLALRLLSRLFGLAGAQRLCTGSQGASGSTPPPA